MESRKTLDCNVERINEVRDMNLKVLISAPGDQASAVEAAISAIERLNQILGPLGHSFETRHWKQNLSTGRGTRAQDVINEQVDDCDAILAIFGPRIGTPTGEYPSGTAEEIFRFIERKKSHSVEFDVHVFFNAEMLGSPFDLDTDQLREIQEFQALLQSKGIYYSQFSNAEALHELIYIGLSNLVGREKQSFASSEGLEEFEELGFDDAIEIYVEELSSARTEIESIGASMRTTTQEIHDLLSDPDRLRNRFDYAVGILDNAASNLEPHVSLLKSHLDKAQGNLSLALTIAVEDFQFTADSAEAIELASALQDGVNSMDEFVDKLRGAHLALASLPRRTSKLNKAKRRLMSMYSKLIDDVSASSNDINAIRTHRLAP